MSNSDIDFEARDLKQRSYTTGDVLLTNRKIELIGKKEFIIRAFDSKHKVFVIYITALNINLSDKVHSLKRAQIIYLKADEAPIKVSSKYVDFIDIFSPKLVIKLSKYIEINDPVIKFVDDRKFFYSFIYNLSPIKLEILKMYIKKNLAKDFIRLS